MGDLNCDLSSTVLDHSSRLLVDITETYNLQQLITEQTRITNSMSTLIDDIFTNAPDRVVCSGVSNISKSDHSLVYAFRKLSVRMPTRGHTTVSYIESLKTSILLNFAMILVRKTGTHFIHQFNNPNDMWHA